MYGTAALRLAFLAGIIYHLVVDYDADCKLRQMPGPLKLEAGRTSIVIGADTCSALGRKCAILKYIASTIVKIVTSLKF